MFVVIFKGTGNEDNLCIPTKISPDHVKANMELNLILCSTTFFSANCRLLTNFEGILILL